MKHSQELYQSDLQAVTILGNVSCMRTQNEADEILQCLRSKSQWVMIYSFGINTDLRIDPNSISYTKSIFIPKA